MAGAEAARVEQARGPESSSENHLLPPAPWPVLASPFAQRQRFHAQAQQLIDAALLALALLGAYLLRSLLGYTHYLPTAQPIDSYVVIGSLVAVAGPFSLSRFGLYQAGGLTDRSALWVVIKGIGVLILFVIAVAFLTKDAQALSRTILACFTAGATAAVWLRHKVWNSVLRSSAAAERRVVALVGGANANHEISTLLQAHPEWRIAIAGAVDTARGVEGPLLDLLHKHHVDEVIVAGERTSFDRLQQVIALCETEGVDVWVFADFVNTAVARMSFDSFHGRPMLRFQSKPDDAWALVAKRAIDLIGSLLGLLVLGPLAMLPTALAIRLTSKGPVLFRQERCGKHGKRFVMYKFRSMVANAEQLRDQIHALNEQKGPVFKVARDPRVTRLGRIMRKLSIDELPQLFNVLCGDMSIVGPRPPLPSEVAEYERWQRRRLSMKPGLTCLWQVSGRSKLSFDQWMALDLCYIDSWSLGLDLKIIARTVPVVLLGTGAH